MGMADDKADVYESFYKIMTCAGALIWSLRPHSDIGGFDTHGEGNNIYSYHAPGFRNQTSPNFDTQEADVVSSTYDARFVSSSAPYRDSALSLSLYIYIEDSSPCFCFFPLLLCARGDAPPVIESSG